MVKKTTSVNFGWQRQHKWLQTLLQNSTRESTWVTCNVKLLSMTPLSVWWLTKHRQNSSIEPLILAAQDDCMGNAGNTHCHQCGQGVVTVWHILRHCHPKRLVHFLHGAARLCSVSSLLWPTYVHMQALQSKKRIAWRFLWNIPSPWAQLLWPAVQTSFTKTNWSNKHLYLVEMVVAGTLSRKNKELRSSSSSLRRPEEVTWLPLEHCPGSHPLSGGKYCWEDCVANRRNAAISSLLWCTFDLMKMSCTTQESKNGEIQHVTI